MLLMDSSGLQPTVPYATSLTMKFKITLLLGLVCLITICSARPADEEYADYEEKPAPVKPTPRHSALLSRRAPIAKPGSLKSTTTTTTPEPVQEEEEAVEEELEEEIPAEPSSTTEAPKKLIKGVVRPFRTNDDLLAVLKRRREQASNHKTHAKTISEPEEPAASHSEPPPKARPQSGRKRFNSKSDAAAPETNEQPSSSPARTGRRFNSKN